MISPPVTVRNVIYLSSTAKRLVGHQYRRHALRSSSRPWCHFSAETLHRKDETSVIENEENDNDRNHLINHFHHLSETGGVSIDKHQIIALRELDRLRCDIMASPQADVNRTNNHESESNSDGLTFLSNLFSFSSLPPIPPPTPPMGVYLHGGVGCGKTFCMDLFYASIPSSLISKQKVHFHKFMLDVHRQMHLAKMVNGLQGDPLPHVIAKLISDGKLICFDEFQVTDVADALILRRLFTGLLEKGAVLVATSNRAPGDLYLNGIQRNLFVPFIRLLEERLEAVSMWDSKTDYRLLLGKQKANGVYFMGEEARVEFERSFLESTRGSDVAPAVLVTQGRQVKIPRCSVECGVACFAFDDLCKTAMGAADYLCIGQRFHTIFIHDVPRLDLDVINPLRRFITFVDVMYECHVKLIVHAEDVPDRLFQVDLENQVHDEVFAFDRTRSRLEEIASDEYLKGSWKGTEGKMADVS